MDGPKIQTPPFIVMFMFVWCLIDSVSIEPRLLTGAVYPRWRYMQLFLSRFLFLPRLPTRVVRDVGHVWQNRSVGVTKPVAGQWLSSSGRSKLQLQGKRLNVGKSYANGHIRDVETQTEQKKRGNGRGMECA